MKHVPLPTRCEQAANPSFLDLEKLRWCERKSRAPRVRTLRRRAIATRRRKKWRSAASGLHVLEGLIVADERDAELLELRSRHYAVPLRAQLDKSESGVVWPNHERRLTKEVNHHVFDEEVDLVVCPVGRVPTLRLVRHGVRPPNFVRPSAMRISSLPTTTWSNAMPVSRTIGSTLALKFRQTIRIPGTAALRCSFTQMNL